MGNARNVGGIGARSGRKPPPETHYITAREAALIAKTQRNRDEGRGVFRRWNGRKLTADQEQRAAKALAKQKHRGKRKPPIINKVTKRVESRRKTGLRMIPSDMPRDLSDLPPNP